MMIWYFQRSKRKCFIYQRETLSTWQSKKWVCWKISKCLARSPMTNQCQRRMILQDTRSVHSVRSSQIRISRNRLTLNNCLSQRRQTNHPRDSSRIKLKKSKMKTTRKNFSNRNKKKSREKSWSPGLTKSSPRPQWSIDSLLPSRKLIKSPRDIFGSWTRRSKICKSKLIKREGHPSQRSERAMWDLQMQRRCSGRKGRNSMRPYASYWKPWLATNW